VAARYQPQPKMQSLIKRLDKAGIRFVYMASRSYRRTRPLAQKMGLETGWNSAISLQPRAVRPLLPTRQAAYGSWPPSWHALAIPTPPPPDLRPRRHRPMQQSRP
jgi:hypothetical protein